MEAFCDPAHDAVDEESGDAVAVLVARGAGQEVGFVGGEEPGVPFRVAREEAVSVLGALEPFLEMGQIARVCGSEFAERGVLQEA